LTRLSFPCAPVCPALTAKQQTVLSLACGRAGKRVPVAHGLHFGSKALKKTRRWHTCALRPQRRDHRFVLRPAGALSRRLPSCQTLFIFRMLMVRVTPSKRHRGSGHVPCADAGGSRPGLALGVTVEGLNHFHSKVSRPRRSWAAVCLAAGISPVRR